jgi:hypothetical protein
MERSAEERPTLFASREDADRSRENDPAPLLGAR